jgi:hypothetical protein
VEVETFVGEKSGQAKKKICRFFSSTMTSLRLARMIQNEGQAA